MSSIRLRTLSVPCLIFLLARADAAPATKFGTVEVRQLDGTNKSTDAAQPSVALSLAPGAAPEASVTGGNRGDYNFAFGNPSDPAAGVIIFCAAQISRDDCAAGGPASGDHGGAGLRHCRESRISRWRRWEQREPLEPLICQGFRRIGNNLGTNRKPLTQKRKPFGFLSRLS